MGRISYKEALHQKYNKFKQPTGKAGTWNDFILCWQRVQLKILKKCKSSLVGGDSADDDSSSEEGGDRNMEWFSEENNEDKVDGENV